MKFIFVSILLFIMCSALLAKQGVFESHNQHNVPFIFGACTSEDGVISHCGTMTNFVGVDGMQVLFAKEQDSLRFVVQVEPNWKGQVIVRRGAKADPNYLGKSLPHTVIKQGERTTINVDFTPCRTTADDCLRFGYGKTLVDYSGVYEIRVMNGKVPLRSALLLVVFAKEDDHISSKIRLFNHGEELHDGTNKKAKCKWFWCTYTKVEFVAPFTAQSVWTEYNGKLYRKYKKVNTKRYTVSATSGKFEMKKRGEYITYFVDKMGRTGSVKVGRR